MIIHRQKPVGKVTVIPHRIRKQDYSFQGSPCLGTKKGQWSIPRWRWVALSCRLMLRVHILTFVKTRSERNKNDYLWLFHLKKKCHISTSVRCTLREIGCHVSASTRCTLREIKCQSQVPCQHPHEIKIPHSQMPHHHPRNQYFAESDATSSSSVKLISHGMRRHVNMTCEIIFLRIKCHVIPLRDPANTGKVTHI